MRSYLSLIPITAKVRKRQNRMTLLCIVIAVFLVATVFSMVQTLADMETESLSSCSDVKAVSGCMVINGEAVENYYVGSQKAAVYGVDETWFTDIWDCLEEGTYPQNDTEVILSANIKNVLGVNIGDSITFDTPSGNMEYTISGFGSHDTEFNAMYDAITIYMTETAVSELCELNNIELSADYYVRFTTDKNKRKYRSFGDYRI